MQYSRSQGSIRSPPDFDGRSPTYNGSFMVHNDIQNILPEAELPSYELPPKYVAPASRRFDTDYNSDIRRFSNRTIHLRRSKPTDQLGFNVRGGAEHKCGIFISAVTPNTDAQKVGLHEGDQILFVNGESFLHIEHTEAVKRLKMNTEVEMVVKYFPYAYDKTYAKCK